MVLRYTAGCLLALAPVIALASSEAGELQAAPCSWQSVATKWNVNPYMLYAIAKTESNLNPRAINRSNANGSEDVGMMQINSFWFPKLAKHGITREHLFDACVSLDVAGWILSENMNYLLIAAPPRAIPWSVQYRWQLDAFVGRIDLEGEALERYVDVLMNGFPQAAGESRKPILWAVDHGAQDITHLMRAALVGPLAAELAALQPIALFEGAATQERLIEALREYAPTFVMTSSHGATYPLDQPDQLRKVLGLPVDQAHVPLDLVALQQVWAPRGCIWYAQACCSAGSDGPSIFSGLFDPTSSLALTLNGIAATGASIAPLPQALLSAASPARAFVGHVEPTFDWTLRDPVTRQLTAQSLIDVVADRLLAAPGVPLGLALDEHYRAVGGLLLDHGVALEEVDEGTPAAKDWARRAKLTAIDRLAMVILGDPTVRMPGEGHGGGQGPTPV